MAFYGATSGEAYISGIAGERFCIRNSGVNAVIEGVGDHGCEYMTGGTVVILGKTGRNFAAGMSGGIAYVLDEDGTFSGYCNKEIVLLEQLKEINDTMQLQKMILKHAEYTGSSIARRILADWDSYVKNLSRSFPKIISALPKKVAQYLQSGMSEQEATIKVFEEVQA